jgi:hypothetical protein
MLMPLAIAGAEKPVTSATAVAMIVRRVMISLLGFELVINVVCLTMNKV